MGVSTISLGLGLGGGKAATSSGRSGGGGGGGFSSTLSAQLDGTNEHVLMNSSYDLGTLSLWFKSDATITKSSSTKALVGFTGVSTYAVYASIQTGGNVTGAVTDELITLYTGDWAYSYSSSSGSINTDWHHLAVRWTGSDYEIYLDGTQVKNDDGQVVGDQSKAKIPISSFDVGIRNGSDRAFDGLIDEVAIWSTPLSASATADLYNSGVPSDLTSLSPNGWWRMGENDSGSNGATIGTVTDQGSGGNNATGTNSPTYSNSVPVNTQLNYPGGIWSSSGSTYFIGTAPTMHFDASIIDGADPNNNPSNGAAVSTWGDRSGNGTNYDASQSNASEQPVYTASGPGSQPTITWNGDKLDLATTWSKSGSITGVFVFQATNDHKASPTGYTGFANQLYNEAFPSHNADFFGGQQATNVSNKQGFNYITARRDGSSAALFEQGGSSILGPLTRSATIYIDRLGDASPHGVHGRYNHLGTISEIMVFDSALSTSELNTIRLYIANKYSISTSAFS